MVIDRPRIRQQGSLPITALLIAGISLLGGCNLDRITSNELSTPKAHEGRSLSLTGTVTIHASEHLSADAKVASSKIDWKSQITVRGGSARASLQLLNTGIIRTQKNSEVSAIRKSDGIPNLLGEDILSVVLDESPLIGRPFEKSVITSRSRNGEMAIIRNEHGLPETMLGFQNEKKITSTRFAYSRIDGAWIVSRQEHTAFDTAGAELVKTVIEIDSIEVADAQTSPFPTVNFGVLVPDVLAPAELLTESCETTDPRPACAAEAAGFLALDLAFQQAVKTRNPANIAIAALGLVSAYLVFVDCLEKTIRQHAMCAEGPLMYDVSWANSYIQNEWTNIINNCIAENAGDPDAILDCQQLENERWQFVVVV